MKNLKLGDRKEWIGEAHQMKGFSECELGGDAE